MRRKTSFAALTILIIFGLRPNVLTQEYRGADAELKQAAAALRHEKSDKLVSGNALSVKRGSMSSRGTGSAVYLQISTPHSGD